MQNELMPQDKLFLLNRKDTNLISEVETLFKDLPLAHSSYQIKNFIIGQFEKSSADRAHKQCLLEIHTRYHSLLDSHYQYRKTQLEIESEEINREEAQYKLDNVVAEDFERRRYEVARDRASLEIGRREFTLINIKKSIGETLREVRCFKSEMDRLSPLRKFPGSYEQAEPEYWKQEYFHRFSQGNRGENLPQIPTADKEGLIESLQNRVKELEGK